MHRIEIPPPEVFENAEAAELALEKADHRNVWYKNDVESLIKVTQYYKALLDGLLASPRVQVLALAERYVRTLETGTGGPVGEDETGDWLDVVAEAYRYYKSQYEAARAGPGTCLTGHEALMRTPKETTTEYLVRLGGIMRDFASQLSAQIGKSRGESIEDDPIPAVGDPDDLPGEIEDLEDELAPKKPAGKPDEKPLPERVEREFESPLLMAGIRFEKTVQDATLGSVVRSLAGGEVYAVETSAEEASAVDKIASKCNMKPVGPWGPPGAHDEAPAKEGA